MLMMILIFFVGFWSWRWILVVNSIWLHIEKLDSAFEIISTPPPPLHHHCHKQLWDCDNLIPYWLCWSGQRFALRWVGFQLHSFLAFPSAWFPVKISRNSLFPALLIFHFCQKVELVELEGRRVRSLNSCKHRSTPSGRLLLPFINASWNDWKPYKRTLYKAWGV